jgi:hypothetical protein
MSHIMPPIPEGLAMPFWYASLQTHWIYVPIDLALARKALSRTACEPYAFVDRDGETAVAVINFQRYTNTGNNYLGTTDEVELNILAYPRSAKGRVATRMTLAQYAYGEDYQKVIGPFRLHVPATNPNAVSAGRALFGEPKFVAFFDTEVPSLNSPPPNSPIRHQMPKVPTQSPTRWKYTAFTAEADPKANPPWKQGKSIYTLEIDLKGIDPIAANATEVVEYGHLDLFPPDYPANREGWAWTDEHPAPKGPLVGGRWSLFGTYALYHLDDDTPYSLTFGDARESVMQIDMRRLLEGRRPVLMRVFDSPPVAAESRAFYVEPEAHGAAR